MKHINSSMALILSLTLMIPGAAATSQTTKTRQLKIRGYITAVNSPTSFEIEDYRITRDEKVELEFENEDQKIKFQPDRLRLGAEVEIQGDYNEETGELKAKKIRIDLAQFKKVKHTAVLTRAPEGLAKSDQGWSGLFFADGRKIRVEPATKVLYRLNRSEKKAAEQKARKAKDKKKNKDEEAEADEDEEAEFEPLGSLSDIGPGVVMSYEGPVGEDGVVVAEQVEFMRNELEKGEARLWKSLKVKEKAPDFQQLSPGELKIDCVGKFKLLPSLEVQQYVSRIGHSLIPQYQRGLADTEPTKIPFRFYVITQKHANAFALPNGIIVVHSGLFEVLENEAQLAAVIGHEIAHSVQEHSWRQRQYHRKKRMALAIGGIAAAAFGAFVLSDLIRMVEIAIRSGYQRSLENQSDRVGLEYMVSAGYDPREAPRVWKLMAKKYRNHPTNFFWSSHDNHTTRRSYLMLEIRNNYGQMDLTAMRKDEEEYQKMAGLAREAASSKKKIKVKT